MNIRDLLHHRASLLHRARLANLAFAYERLADYAQRIRRAGLHGPATIEVADPAADRFWPALLAWDAAPAVIDEHFLEEEIAELEEILRYLRDEGFEAELEFDLEGFTERLLPALRRELERAGVTVPTEAG